MKMKKQYIILALGAMFMASCADEFDRNFEVGRPELTEEYAYLSDYKALKEYVSDPNFKLGIGTDAADYAKQGPTYVITNVNFTETVAGNAMKMASCVDDNGSMNFGTVEEYVNAAHAAGINIYGHTLAWHAQQPVKWLNSLIADKPLPVTPGGEQEVEDYYQDLTTVESFPYYVMGYTPNYSKEEGLISEYPGGWYQYFIATGIKTDANADYTYKLTCEVKSDKSGDVGVQMRWAWADDAVVSSTLRVAEGDWQEISCEFKNVKGTPCDVIFQPGGFDGRFCIKNIKISHIEETAGGTTGVMTEVKEKRRCIRVVSDDMVEHEWDTQFWLYFPDNVIHTGDKYEFSADLMADKAASAGSQTHKDPGGYIHWAAIGTLPFTEEWTTFTSSGTFSDAAQEGGYSIAFNMNDFNPGNIYYLDNISLKINGVEVIKNGDCEGDDTSSFRSKEMRGSTGPSTIVDETVVNRMQTGPVTIENEVKRTCVQVVSDDMVEHEWDTQFWLYFPDHVIHGGDSYEVSMNVRADKKASAGTQTHKDAGAYIHWAGIGTVPFETEWKEYKQSGTFASECEGGYSIAFNLNDFNEANTYYFDDISLKINGVEVIKNGDCDDLSDNSSFRAKEQRGSTVPARIVDHYIEIIESNGGIPLTPQEKKDTLTYAMDKWIHGMMDACRDEDGNLLVKAWDVVNEPIGANGQLQHASEDNKTDFFWQDYLGDEDYVRTAVKLARQYGGNDLKLFVNDYNLEYDWDASGNKKLEALISWINKWESDGVTKIDGIGSQMHISCYADPEEAAKRKELIVKSFKMMAETGKLVRISELDMGYVDANGNAVKTVNMTEEQHHQMADLYKWIIQQYKANIPEAQQWGITLWCATDAPANSGWRPGEPVGIWDQNYYRKHVYAGVADGLSGE